MTKHKTNEIKYSMLENYEIVDHVPVTFPEVNEESKDFFDMFDRIKEKKFVKITFPSETMRIRYLRVMKYYASFYEKILKFRLRKNDKGYYVFIEVKEDEKTIQ